MTPEEKAKETRQRNRELQIKDRTELQELREKMKSSLLSVLDDKDASPKDKLKATELLMKLV